jgi:Tfp pilus assembly protein PilX
MLLPLNTRNGMIDMRHLNRRRHLSDEDGFVLPTAIIVLLILTVLIGAAITVAAQTSTSTTRDNNTKAALEAAEAGLQTASYRLSKLEPKWPESCINGKVEVKKENECNSGIESLGNGTSFEYWTSFALAAGTKCAGEVTTIANSTQRCITSVGTVGGVKRRLQERAALNRPPLFAVKGIMGYKSVSVKQVSELKGAIGTNGTITLTNGDTVTESVLGPNGKIVGSGSPGTIIKSPTAFEPPTVPIGKSADGAADPSKCKPPLQGEPPAAGPNCDFRITYGINKTNPLEADATSGVTFNAATRALDIKEQGSSLILKEGIYNFCSFVVEGNNSKIETAVGARVEIFIDSANREGSGCTKTQSPAAGTLSLAKNGLEIKNPNPDATYLQVYVYDGSGGTIEIKNNSSSEFYGTIVAPQSKLSIGNGGSFTGAIMANEVELINGFTFKWEEKVEKLLVETTTYERKAWAECPPTYSVTNPQEGC